MDFTPIYSKLILYFHQQFENKKLIIVFSWTANKTDPGFQLGPTWKPYYSARKSYNSYLDPPHPEEASLNATFWHRVTEVFEKNECVPASHPLREVFQTDTSIDNRTVFQLFNTRLSRGGKIEDCSGPICKKNTMCMLRSMRSESNCVSNLFGILSSFSVTYLLSCA